MRLISLSSLAVECCGSGGSSELHSSGSAPFVLSPDTDSTAIALEEMAIALETIATGIGERTQMVDTLRMLGGYGSGNVSTENSDYVKYGIIGAIIAAIVAAIMFIVQKFKTKDASAYGKQLDKIEEIVAKIEQAEAESPIEVSDPDLAIAKKEMWAKSVRGLKGFVTMNFDLGKKLSMEMSKWAAANDGAIQNNHYRFKSEVEKALANSEAAVTTTIHTDPKPLYDVMVEVAAFLGEVPNIKVEDDLGKLQYCNAIADAVGKYQPTYDEAKMKALMDRGIASKAEISMLREHVKSVKLSTKSLNTIAAELLALKSKASGAKNASLADVLNVVLQAIKLVKHQYQWMEVSCDLNQAIAVRYAAYLKKRKSKK